MRSASSGLQIRATYSGATSLAKAAADYGVPCWPTNVGRHPEDQTSVPKLRTEVGLCRFSLFPSFLSQALCALNVLSRRATPSILKPRPKRSWSLVEPLRVFLSPPPHSSRAGWGRGLWQSLPRATWLTPRWWPVAFETPCWWLALASPSCGPCLQSRLAMMASAGALEVCPLGCPGRCLNKATRGLECVGVAWVGWAVDVHLLRSLFGGAAQLGCPGWGTKVCGRICEGIGT